MIPSSNKSAMFTLPQQPRWIDFGKKVPLEIFQEMFSAQLDCKKLVAVFLKNTLVLGKIICAWGYFSVERHCNVWESNAW